MAVLAHAETRILMQGVRFGYAGAIVEAKL